MVFDVFDEGTIYKCIRGKVLLTVIFECLICQAIIVRTRVRTAIRQVCFQIQIAMCIVTSVWYRVLHYILYKGEEVFSYILLYIYGERLEITVRERFYG